MQNVFKFSNNHLHLVQMDLPVDETFGEVDIFVRSSGQADLWSDVPPRVGLWVRSTFGQTSGQTDLLSDVPPASGFQSD